LSYLQVAIQYNAVNKEISKNNILFTYDFWNCLFKFVVLILMALFILAGINYTTYILLNLRSIFVISISLVIFELDTFLIISSIDICNTFSFTGLF
jgi:hypothetical protein